MKKANYEETPRGNLDISLKATTKLQLDLKALGYHVTFHPTFLKIHTRIDKEHYVYLKENKVF